MKKYLNYIALLVIAVFFVGCKEHQTPLTDTTRLYPACDAKGEKWGFINPKGDFIIPPIYKDVTGFSCGYALVWIGNGDSPMFIDTKGKIQYSSADDAEPFYYKYARFAMGSACGFLNTSFRITCQPIYESLGNMTADGLATAKLKSDKKYGYVDANGEWKIQAIYDYASDFDEGIAVVGFGDRMGVINKDASFAIQPLYEHLYAIGNGLVAFEQSDNYGILDRKGNFVVQPIYEEIGICFDNDLIPVEQYEKVGYVNTKGDLKIDCMYDNGTSFYEGCAWVEINDREQIIDTKGQTVILFDDRESVVTLFHNGLALIAVEGEDGTTTYKYIDKRNTTIYSWRIENAWQGTQGNRGKVAKTALPNSKSLIEMTERFDSRYLH